MRAEKKAGEQVTDENYGRVLEGYISDIRKTERLEQEMRKIELMEKTMKNGTLDFVFPWHMQLGRFENDSVVLFKAPG